MMPSLHGINTTQFYNGGLHVADLLARSQINAAVLNLTNMLQMKGRGVSGPSGSSCEPHIYQNIEDKYSILNEEIMYAGSFHGLYFLS